MNQPIEHIASDEIDLYELFRHLWILRLMVLWAFILGGLFGGAYFLSSWVKQPLVSVATLELRFNFPNIQNGAYPSGQPFSINDLVAPSILNQVHTQFKLDQYGLSLGNFSNAVQIAPFATNREFIEARFKSLLAKKNLSATEIDEVNENYSLTLEAASRRFAKLSFIVEADLAIATNVQTAVLAAIPATWAKESIESYGVLDIPSATIEALDTDLINSFEYLAAARYLENYRLQIDQSATVLQKDSVGRLLVDEESGRNSDAIVRELSLLREFHIDVLQRSFAVSPVARDVNNAITYLKNELIGVEEHLDLLNRRAAVVDKAYMQIFEGDQKASDPELSNNPQQTYPTQYGDEFLNRLMSIGDEQSESKFKQSLINRSIKLKLEAEEIKTRINSLQSNLREFESSTGSTGDHAEKLAVEAQINSIATRLQALALSLNRIADLRSKRVLGQTGALFDLNSEPQIRGNFLNQMKSMIKFIILGSVAGLMIGLFVAFVRASVRNARRAN